MFFKLKVVSKFLYYVLILYIYTQFIFLFYNFANDNNKYFECFHKGVLNFLCRRQKIGFAI